ncbi:hypothetical protein FQA39_LY00834 [Lamprigera yunnana]|nr:hypothetical protein FQA39_LY00834 [Lamprigera yunnana]
MSYTPFLFLVFIPSQIVGGLLPKAGCAIDTNKDLGDPQPLLILQNDAETDIEAFVLPDDISGVINFNKGETFDIVCPEGKVVIDGTTTNTDVLEAACKSSLNFIIGGKSVLFPKITCTKQPGHTARYTGKKCASKYKEIEIGFHVQDRFIRHITTCFDEDLQHVLYSENYLVFNVAGSQVNFPRPDFQVSDFYNVKPDSVSDLYSKKGQRKTINGILGLDESDPSIIQPSGNTYLATGHYTPKADFIYGSQQRLTFYYVNAAPQWQSFNGGNWNTMEANYRKLAIDRELDFTIYSGSYGIATLPDVNGDEQELYLWIGADGQKGIPVPALFFKVVYEPISEAGVVLLGFNNPHKEFDESYMICKNVCSKITWLTWKPENSNLGFGYCCEVNDFRKTVKYLPKFTVRSLLI